MAVVNEAFAKKYLAGVDPLRQQIVVEQLIPGVTKLGPGIEWQIVGVYRDVKNGGPRAGRLPGDRRAVRAEPLAGGGWPCAPPCAPTGRAKSIAAVVHRSTPDLPVTDVKTMDQLVSESLAGDRFTRAALRDLRRCSPSLLAAVGIYGVMSFVVAQRTHEIGLRMALGAARGRLLWSVLREGLVTSLLGIAVGSVGAYAIGRLLQGTSDLMATVLDPASLAVVVATLVGAALLACYLPARRAASVDPMTALRQD